MFSTTINFTPVGEVKLHRNIAWDNIFRTYDAASDGIVHIATYSFDQAVLSAWERLQPFFRVIVAPGPRDQGDRYLKSAEHLARTHPLSEVRVARNLHTKAVLFQGSGRLFIGSQNFFSRYSTFDETIVEMRLLPHNREEVLDALFRTIKSDFVRPIFTFNDLKIYRDGKLAGYAHVPPNRTVQHWHINGPERFKITAGVPKRDYDYYPGRLYALMCYEFKGGDAIMAFDRGYTFCGEVTSEAFRWLCKYCKIIETQGSPCGYWSGGLDRTYLAKDEIIRIHPVTQLGPPKECVYIDRVLDLAQHKGMLVSAPKINLKERMH
jgi:hypothetical protein